MHNQTSLYTKISNSLQKSRKATFISGPAGSGKSTLIKHLSSCEGLGRTVVLSSTGISAQSIGGRTIHSAFRLGHELVAEKEKITKQPCKSIRDADTIIVDEVSMARADVIDRCNFILKKSRNNNKRFGGARLVFLGDFYQLPPVCNAEIRSYIKQLGYDSPYAYSAKIFGRHKPYYFELPKVHRQSDPVFIRYLAKLRLGENSSEVLDYFNDNFLGKHISESALIITPCNKTAAIYNDEFLLQEPGRTMTFDGVKRGKYSTKQSPPFKLTLKIGAKVMATQNNPIQGYQNGSTGIVVEMKSDEIRVKFDHLSKPVGVKRYTWGDSIAQEEDSSFTQFPLILAYALTVHRSQGLTLNSLKVDPSYGFFADGQAYVALSRIREPSSLSLVKPLKKTDIKVETVHSYRLEKMLKLKID